LTGLIYTWSIFRFRLLDLTPIARAAVVHSLPDGIMALDDRRRVIDINPAAQVVLGLVADDVIGRTVDEVWPFYHERPVSADQTSVHQSDLTLSVKSQPRHFEVVSAPLLRGTTEVAGWTLVFHDVTVRQQAEEELRRSREQLRELAARQESTREEERARIAREIHDVLGHQLTALRMALGKLTRSLPAIEAQQAEQVRDLDALASEMIRTVRRIATELRPAVLDDFGLQAAIEAYLQDFERRSGIRGVLEAEGEWTHLAPELSLALFRIAQEALTNVARHAQASQVVVRLRHAYASLILEVCDNGCGIDVDAAAQAASFGIAGMRERVRLLGGELLITGSTGAGTTVQVKLPRRL
jgi:two-component system, NarL family, sensor histidine kinase UhpB